MEGITNKLRRDDLIYPELCYQIIGVVFEVFNELGFGHSEKHYQRAIARALKLIGLKFREQVMTKIEFKDEVIGKYFLDFLIEDKVVLEIKKSERFSKQNIEQVYKYLKATGLKLGIIVNFTRNGVKFKRIVNLNS